jgi:potassium efflux system protein
VLPAAGFLSQIVLWPGGPTVVEASEVGAGGVVTLAHLLGAIIVGIATAVAARNIPGLLEVVLLKRLPLAPSARFAISTVSRYAIVLVGGLLAFGSINIGWSKVQWLAAAFSVGIGFGLQEIFANFISGLIMLFERPIRIGDIVTVGETTGKVTQIRMRATVITDFDERELLVPNKEFVTSRLINWTLTDPMTRATIEVGVAYGSDTAKAKELLLAAARRQSRILREPPPRAFFLQFGDSTLLLRLNYYIPTRDVYLDMKDALHSEIDRTFREAGIEIAFPQMDLHLRSFEPRLAMEARDGTVVELKEAGPPPAP